MLRSKILASINVIGLSLGIACAVLIILFVKDELTFDKFHSKAERIYRPWTEAKMRGRESVNSATPFSMGKQLYENYEEIEKYTVWTSFNDAVEIEEESFSENINIAGSQFFDIFDFEVLNGSVNKALDDPGDMVVTREIAEKYFGGTDVSGNLLKVQVGGEIREFEVQAVLENVPTNSSLQFDIIISDEHLKNVYPERMLTSWFMITGENYVLLKEGSDPDVVEPKFASLVEQTLSEQAREMEYNIHLQPIKDIHLNTEIPANNASVSDPKYVYILSGIAILIVSIACINFMTLALGRSLSRTREIGVRKTVGASRFQLIRQFLGEAILTSLIALLLGMFLAFLGLNWFNELSGKELVFDLSIINLVLFISLALVAGLLSGFYPAIVMSGIKSADIIKGSISIGAGKQRLRMILVGSQFVLAIFLIACTLIMKDQMHFLQNKDLGFDKENVVVVPLSVPDARGVRDVVNKGMEKSRQIKSALASRPELIDVGVSSHTFEPGTWTEVGWMDENDQQYQFFYNTVDEDFINTLQIELVAGRNFSPENLADARRSIIVNESFVKAFDLDDPVGGRIPHEDFDDHEIIGVVKDFHIQSLHTPIQPLVMTMNVNIGFSGAQSVNIGSSEVPKLFIRTGAGQMREALAAVEQVYAQTYPGEPYDYSFIDENLKEQYDRERNFENIVTSASLISLLIGSMGLFGLSALTINARIREVGIRKVFGATRKSLFMELSKSFAFMILIAMVLAAPVSWMVMEKWLDQFEYKVVVTPYVFLTAGIMTLILAVTVISFQAVKVSNTNPASALRAE